MSHTITTASLSDSLPSSVPKLDPAGANWSIFLFRFQDAVEAKGYWGHFDGTDERPTTAKPNEPTEDETNAMKQWDKDERSAKTLLTQKIPDSTVVLIHSKKLVRERWEAVVKEFSKKSAYAMADLRAKFMALRCPDKTNPRDFLENLRVKKEELSQAGISVEEKDYLSVILSSLPFHLSNFASTILATSHVSSTELSPDDLISMLIEESDRQRAQRLRGRVPGKGKEEENEVLVVGEVQAKGKKGNWKGKGRHTDMTCYNCNKKGHIARFCKEPKKPKNGKGDSERGKHESASGSGNVHAVEPKDQVEEGAWMVEMVEDLDWFEEAVRDMEGKGCADVVENLNDTSGIAFVTESVNTVRTAELYDSGCTNHISPYRAKFENFVTTTPRIFRAANKQTFSTIGKGELVIDVPDGDN